MLNDALLKDLATCESPETLLAAILRHHPDLQAPVPLEALAHSMGIVELRELDADGVVSTLLTDVAKAHGVIDCAAGLSAQRRRFAIAHQLGHFLIRTQRGDRRCTGRDLSENRRDTPHRKEEMQANRFAAGLLMPKPLFVAFVERLGKPTVAHLPTIATGFDVTLEAAASRYLDLATAMFAILFVRDEVVRYARTSRSFPALAIRVGEAAPPAIHAAGAPAGTKDRIAWLPADVRDWIVTSREQRQPILTMQILGKRTGTQVVFLFVNAAAERRADEEAEKLATERIQFGRPSRA